MSEETIENEEKCNLDLITSSISVCIEKGQTSMNEQVTEATRKYYLSIVNNHEMSIDEKRHKIYQDLVIGTKANLSLNIDNDENNKNNHCLSLSYRIGLEDDEITTVNGEIICIGQYKENDIYIPSNHVSRIHCFIFQINDKLIILDGWSKCGTKTIDIASNNDHNDHNDNDNDIDNDNDDKQDEEKEKKEIILISSLPKQRNILQYDMRDTIHLKLGNGNWGTDIIINPKTCIVCMDKARVLRLRCGHQVLCNQCYNKLKQNMHSSQCPICRKPFNFNGNNISSVFREKINVKNYNKYNNNSNNSNGNNTAIVSAGVHTFAFSASSTSSTQ